jgi:hypothetical protein
LETQHLISFLFSFIRSEAKLDSVGCGQLAPATSKKAACSGLWPLKAKWGQFLARDKRHFLKKERKVFHELLLDEEEARLKLDRNGIIKKNQSD